MARKVLLCCYLMFATVAWSQDRPLRYEVFGGYTYTPSNFSLLPNGENGWAAAATVNAKRWIGFKADFAQYRSTLSVNGFSAHDTSTTFLFGPQITIPGLSRIRPFGDFLVGGVHPHDCANGRCFSAFRESISFLWSAGGGIDLQLTKHFWLRGEGDYLHNHFTTTDNQLQYLVTNSRARLVTGLVFRF